MSRLGELKKTRIDWNQIVVALVNNQIGSRPINHSMIIINIDMIPVSLEVK